MFDIENIFRAVFIAWKEGGRFIRVSILIALVSGAIAVVCVALHEANFLVKKSILENVAVIFGFVCVAILFGINVSQSEKEEAKREKKIEAVEKRVLENPKETKAAWELATVKLESYLDRNLSQVKLIFYLTLFVMSVGFALISIGVVLIYRDPTALAPGIVAAASGIVVNFIGATFLVLYKATMTQATDYVAILERINAVGMSVQIIETIDDQDDKLKHQTSAEIAKQLLAMYSDNAPSSRKKKLGVAG